VLDGVVASILCERWHAVPAGDHTLFIGRVLGGTATERAPLLHFRGDYTTTEDGA
jgi:flavin reductase (DIM6/NTAB) family NADH-FMN oxidoreductase RutF